ncbi:MAG: GNAT family N-acetyltransferase [Pirellulaceae bacterium]|jgi:GNAT superfamily N-acetyltransferase|nr:GNAT family N-acetyltransferase [Pirellulaceae bacterium]MDP7015934.1 GNAT family N-acetyltransferase [Pirellulaceae bacterium]
MSDSLDFICRIVDDAGDEAAVVKGLLRSYNRAANPVWWEAAALPEHEPRKLHVLARDAEDAVIGGLLGASAMSWLRIDILAVREDLRRQGVGSALLQAAEEEARRRDCKYVYLDTMDYQSPDFYRQRGYSVAGKIDDWDSHNHARSFFTKRL